MLAVLQLLDGEHWAIRQMSDFLSYAANQEASQTSHAPPSKHNHVGLLREIQNVLSRIALQQQLTDTRKPDSLGDLSRIVQNQKSLTIHP
jgi:hypothetical protein